MGLELAVNGSGEVDEVRAGFPGIVATVVVEDGEFAFLRVASGVASTTHLVLLRGVPRVG